MLYLCVIETQVNIVSNKMEVNFSPIQPCWSRQSARIFCSVKYLGAQDSSYSSSYCSIIINVMSLFTWPLIQFSSVQSLSHVGLFASHGLQQTRPPSSSPTPGTCSNSCPSSWRCHPTISSSVVPCPPIFNLSQHQGFFQIRQCFTSGGQTIGVSASASVLLINIQG